MVQAVERIILGWLVSKIIIIIVNFRVGTFENEKSIFHQGYIWKRPCLFILWYIGVKYCKFFAFYLFYFNRKEKGNISRKTDRMKNYHLWNQYYSYFDLAKIRIGQAHTTKNIVLLPSQWVELHFWIFHKSNVKILYCDLMQVLKPVWQKHVIQLKWSQNRFPKVEGRTLIKYCFKAVED